MPAPYRDNASHADLQDYYDTVPPAHRLSDIHSPYTSTQDIPLTSSYPAATSSYLPASRDYSNIDTGTTRNNQWLENKQSKGKSKWVVLGSILAIIGLIIIGVVVGVVVSKHNSQNSSSTSNSGSSVVNETSPGDPSSFTKDPNLKLSFYGLAYTPYGSQLPNCGNNLTDVITDIQLLSQLTTRIRLYGADCNQSALVLEAIKQTKVNVSVFLGNYPISTDNNTAYDRQRGEIQSAIQTYGTDHVLGVTVGNEFMLDYLNLNGATDPNGAVGNTGAALLIADINDTRSMLSSMGMGTLPVGTAEAGAYFNTMVLEAIDYGMANVHPWFANVSINQAAAWTAEFFSVNNVQVANALSNKPAMSIAETGWPTNSSDVSNESNGPSNASEANLQASKYFMDTFVCQANSNGTAYFFFEYFDEPWKAVQFGGVEGYWGLFHANRTLKNINIPSC